MRGNLGPLLFEKATRGGAIAVFAEKITIVPFEITKYVQAKSPIMFGKFVLHFECESLVRLVCGSFLSYIIFQFS
jgi:hypothetical protein